MLHPGNSLACAVVTGYLSNYEKQYQQAIFTVYSQHFESLLSISNIEAETMLFSNEPYRRTFRAAFHTGSYENREM